MNYAQVLSALSTYNHMGLFSFISKLGYGYGCVTECEKSVFGD